MKLIRIVLFIGLISTSSSATESIVYPTAILGAFEEELTWLKDKLDHPDSLQVMGYNFLSGEIEGQLVVLALTGVGKVNAAVLSTLLIEHFQPHAVIFTGVAGAIGKDHIPGDVVIADSVIQHDMGDMTPEGLVPFGVRNPLTSIHNPVFFPADEKLLESALHSVEHINLERAVQNPEVREPEMTHGIIATGDAFITSTPKKIELRDNLGVLAVEMEGAAVAQVCYQLNVPCLVIRGISDFSDENADQDFEKYYQAAARNANRVVINILKRMNPGKSDFNVYKDEKYGLGFEYPLDYDLKMTRDPEGGLIYAVLKSENEEIQIIIDLFDLSGYPREILASRAATFEDAARYVAELTSAADGPDGSRYCSKVDVRWSFRNPQSINCLELSISETVEDYSTNTSTTEMRDPVFMLDFSPTGRRMILIIESDRNPRKARSILEEIVASVQL